LWQILLADPCGESRVQIPFTLIGRGRLGISSIFRYTTWKVVAKKAFSTQRDKGTKGQRREKHHPVAPFDPLFLCPFVLFFALPLAVLTRLQRKISGKGEPLPDGDSGK
jgi:hypothetical protein